MLLYLYFVFDWVCFAFRLVVGPTPDGPPVALKDAQILGIDHAPCPVHCILLHSCTSSILYTVSLLSYTMRLPSGTLHSPLLDHSLNQWLLGWARIIELFQALHCCSKFEFVLLFAPVSASVATHITTILC